MRFLYFLIIASCWGLTAQGQATIRGRVMHDTARAQYAQQCDNHHRC